MLYAASHSKAVDPDDATNAVCDAVTSALNGAAADLAFLFVSHAHAPHFDRLARDVFQKSHCRVLLGSTGETIVGGDEEIESGPAVSLWAASLPDVAMDAFHVQFANTPDGIACDGLPTGTSNAGGDVSAIFVLGEPFSSAPNSIIDRLADDFPEIPVMGGMASGGHGPNTNRLFLNGESIAHGAIGIVLRGGPRIRSIVSQGCRPIGQTYVVTKAEDNIIMSLGGAPPIQRLQEMLPTLPERDQQLMQSGLHVGIVMNEYQETFERGDFLISNVIGMRPEDNAIAIGNPVRTGQTVRFQVRDAAAADEDLLELMRTDQQANPRPPQAGLLFSCNGRGTRLFPAAHHDARAIQQQAGPIPLAGFFAQGELGPVGRKNYIHGFTASIALFE